MQKSLATVLDELKAGKYDEELRRNAAEMKNRCIENALRQMSEGISVDGVPGSDEWANHIVYSKEPYAQDESALDFIQHYLEGLNYLRKRFLETSDMSVYETIMALMPAALYFAKYDDEVDI